MRRRALLAASMPSGGDDGPITFTVEAWHGVLGSYTIPHSMTWEVFVNSEYNPVNELGDKYFRNQGEQIQYAYVYEEDTPDGVEYWTEYMDLCKKGLTDVEAYVYSYEYISGENNYII